MSSNLMKGVNAIMTPILSVTIPFAREYHAEVAGTVFLVPTNDPKVTEIQSNRGAKFGVGFRTILARLSVTGAWGQNTEHQEVRRYGEIA